MSNNKSYFHSNIPNLQYVPCSSNDLIFLDKRISDHQQSWRDEDGPWKRPRPPLLVAADLGDPEDRAGRAPAPNTHYWTRGILFAISYSKTASILLSSW